MGSADSNAKGAPYLVSKGFVKDLQPAIGSDTAFMLRRSQFSDNTRPMAAVSLLSSSGEIM